MPDHQEILFSDDTIHFDTVFSSLGSVTKELLVYNRSGYKIKIDQIYLSGGTASQFRLNIDGDPVSDKSDVEIARNDSMFIFIDVLVDPADVDSPVAIVDSLIFRYGGNEKNVKLLAWGQDIILLDSKTIGNETWRKGKPFVIFNNLLVDTSRTLTIEEGTRVYFHRNSSMTVAGTLIVNGTPDSPVTFASDRLEKIYEDIPGQWEGIRILNCSSGNNINNAFIRNAENGIYMGETVTGTGKPALKLSSVTIMHSSVSGISAINSGIQAVNCVISHCGSYCVYIASGGDYAFIHCTFSNWWDYGLRLTPALYITTVHENFGAITGPVRAEFNNCVITGGNNSELAVNVQDKSHDLYYYFGYCLIKLDTLKSPFWAKELFHGCVVNKDPLFLDFARYDFRPDTLSPLIDSGDKFFAVIYPFDIRGESRSKDQAPDIGAYERKLGEHKIEK
jgi:hypothetical protein